jgi:hypothetical protein
MSCLRLHIPSAVTWAALLLLVAAGQAATYASRDKLKRKVHALPNEARVRYNADCFSPSSIA